MNSTRRPSFQFYPQDWIGDTNLKSCSLEAQGFWIKFMCILHDSKVYGIFCFSKIEAKDIPNGIANILISSDICYKVARVVGISQEEAMRVLNELINADVIKIDENGYLFSSRMVRDEKLRKIRQDAGSHGGKKMWKQRKDDKSGDLFAKAKVIANSEQTVEDEDEDEDEDEKVVEDVVLGGTGDFSIMETFEKFWKIYDKNFARISCEKLWIDLTPQERTDILDYIPKYVASQPDKQYRVHPEKFLYEKLWYNEIIPAKLNGHKNGHSKKPTGTELEAAIRKKVGR